MRKGTVKRRTKETDVEIEIDLDGAGRGSIATGIGFLDHMLDLLARHSRIDIAVKARATCTSIITIPPKMLASRSDRPSSRPSVI